MGSSLCAVPRLSNIIIEYAFFHQEFSEDPHALSSATSRLLASTVSPSTITPIRIAPLHQLSGSTDLDQATIMNTTAAAILTLQNYVQVQ
jgi:hypothetical protein